MGKPGEDSATGPEDPVPSLLRDYGDALEAACPPLGVAVSAARLRGEARARGLLRPEGSLAGDLAATGVSLEQQAPPFDVEAGAARLLETARDRGLLPGTEAGASEAASSQARREDEPAPPARTELNSRYRLVSRLRDSGSGSVWLAEDLLLERPVALKELVPHRGIPGTYTERRRAMREARALARIRHPAVAGVHDVFLADEDPWMVMEFVSGRPLSAVIAPDSPLDERAVAAIGLQAARGLAAVHRAGVVHRDLKPENILVTGNNSVVLVDFGIARITASEEPLAGRRDTFLGTPEHVAPERFRGSDDGPAVDLWSLGVALYHALEGRSPFRRDDSDATIQAIIHEAPPVPARQGRLSEVVLRLLDKNPAGRPASSEVADELHSILADSAIRAPYPGQDPRLPLPAHAESAPGPGLRPSEPTGLSAADAEQMASMFKALADPVRLRLFSRIAARQGADSSVADIQNAGVTQPTVSYHLRKLHEAGLIVYEQGGTWAYCRLAPGVPPAITTMLSPGGHSRDESAEGSGSSPVPAQAGPEPLTAWERNIATLVASGMSNREIASMLLISKRTVDAHVEHVFSKLGVSSRIQLTAWLRDRRFQEGSGGGQGDDNQAQSAGPSAVAPGDRHPGG
jgi:serine/threonine protein kinase